MAVAGRVAIVPKGEWSANATYKRLDAVTHNNTLYFAKKNVPAGTVTSNTEYWSKSIAGGASAIATTEDAGVVKPDGKSMSVDESGTLSINLDGTTITLDEAKNVIKLADTLKDKIGSALQPESIVNNQVTTETGYALDARQANPNLDGTLAKQISDLNGSLKIEGNPNVTIVNGAGEVLNYKCGNLSMISIEITPSKITHGLILATGIYTPVRSFYLSFITIDGHAVPLVLNSNGELSIYYPNQTVESPKRIDGSFAYICA
jgi:hypothetical protein